MPSQRKINQLLDKLEPAAARAFLAAASRIRSSARLRDLEAAITAQDIDRAMRAAGLSAGAWSDVTEAARRSYIEGGNLVAADAPASLGFAFDLNNPAAQAWLATHSSDLVTRINADQRDAIRAALAAGFEQGRNPRSIALDIVGRVDRATGRRQGGIVGLTEQMAGYVRNMQQTLETNPRAYFIKDQKTGELKHRYKRADKRFDARIKRAIASGEPLSRADINRITGRYADRLLKLRGDNIGRTEVLGSLNEGMDQALRQAVEENLIQPGNIRRIWDATGDSRTRPDHTAADGQEVGLSQPFTVGGVQMMHPGDFGAPPAQVINCRCVVRQQVDWIGEEL